MRRMVFLLTTLTIFVATAVSQVNDSGDDVIPSSVHAIHSQLFDDRPEGLLVERVLRLGEGSVFRERGALFIDPNNPPTAKKSITRMICSSDVVAIVLIKRGESSFSSKRNWVFTDYLASVQQVIKDDKSNSLPVNRNVVIARSGGVVEVTPGKRIRVEDESSPKLQLGKQYVVFLKSVPGSGQYVSYGSEFNFFAQRLHPVFPDPFLDEIGRGYELSDLVDIAKSCEEKSTT